MPRLALLIVLYAAFAGCNERNSEFCNNPANAEHPTCKMGGPCTSSMDCKDISFPACDTADNGGTCVMCTANDHALCTGMTPICDNHTCVACVNDSDCGNDSLCLPNGACAPSSDVAYVDGTGGMDGAPCTQEMPCTKIDVAAGLKQIVKVSGIVQDRCSLDGKTVTIFGQPGAKLKPMGSSNDGPALEIKGASHVEVYDLEINHANGGTMKDASGVLVAGSAEVLMTRVTLLDNTADGAHVASGHFTCTLCTIAQNDIRGITVTAGMLTISQSTIKENVEGGIDIGTDGSFQIVGNVIFKNGKSDKVTGGININVNGSMMNRLDFNSLSQNTAPPTGGQNIRCSSVMPLTANNNIIWSTGATLPSVSGDCSYAYSDIGPLPVQVGSTNMTTPPQFKDENAGDLHLLPISPLRQKADPAAVLTGLAARDIDGDLRVSPRADLGADLGADQTP